MRYEQERWAIMRFPSRIGRYGGAEWDMGNGWCASDMHLAALLHMERGQKIVFQDENRRIGDIADRYSAFLRYYNIRAWATQSRDLTGEKKGQTWLTAPTERMELATKHNLHGGRICVAKYSLLAFSNKTNNIAQMRE